MDQSPEAVIDLAKKYTAAWCAHSAEEVTSFFSDDAQFIINRGEPWIGHGGIAEMATGFFTDVPDLLLISDDVRCSGDHAINVWTFTGHHADTGNAVEVRGWEEWTIGPDMKITLSKGWYDADGYARQVAGD